MLIAERGLHGNLGPPFLDHPCEAHDDNSSFDSVFYLSSRAFFVQLCPQILWEKIHEEFQDVDKAEDMMKSLSNM